MIEDRIMDWKSTFQSYWIHSCENIIPLLLIGIDAAIDWIAPHCVADMTTKTKGRTKTEVLFFFLLAFMLCCDSVMQMHEWFQFCSWLGLTVDGDKFSKVQTATKWGDEINVIC